MGFPTDPLDRKAKVFISYKRDLDPDQTLAEQLLETLRHAGHDAVIDQDIPVGDRWGEWLDKKIRESDFLILLLSEASCLSEMVRGEVEIARDQASRSDGRPEILPIRVKFQGFLPYPLQSYLAGIQHELWRGPTDDEKLAKKLLGRLARPDTGRRQKGTTLQPPDTAPDPLLPTYSAPLRDPTGAIAPDDPMYIERRTDAKAMALIKSDGQTMTIKGPRQMGKSSLLIRIVAAAERLGKRPVRIDLQLFDSTSKESGRTFFRQFSAAIGEELHLPKKDLQDFWDPESPDPQNCSRFLRKIALPRAGAPLVLAIDEVDSLFGLPFGSDFFSMLRSWHNNRALPGANPWKRLDLVLATSTEPHMFIDPTGGSPFNVGATLALADFAKPEVDELCRRYRASQADAEGILSLLGGHPYLTRKALFEMATDPGVSLADLAREAAEDNGPFGDHLRYYLLRLQGQPELRTAFYKVIHGRGCDDEVIAYRLEGAGLVRRTKNGLEARCRLYLEYFGKRLRAHG
jgi:hypothetical protein